MKRKQKRKKDLEEEGEDQQNEKQPLKKSDTNSLKYLK